MKALGRRVVAPPGPQRGPGAPAPVAWAPSCHGALHAHGLVTVDRGERGGPHQEASVQAGVIGPGARPQGLGCEPAYHCAALLVVHVRSVIYVQFIVPYGALFVRRFGTNLKLLNVR